MRFYSLEGFFHLNILYSSVALQAEIVNEESINQSSISSTWRSSGGVLYGFKKDKMAVRSKFVVCFCMGLI